jgi:hypothetical protein
MIRLNLTYKVCPLKVNRGGENVGVVNGVPVVALAT